MRTESRRTHLADTVELSLEVPVGHASRVLYENLYDVRLRALGGGSDHGVVERNVPPPEHLCTAEKACPCRAPDVPIKGQKHRRLIK